MMNPTGVGMKNFILYLVSSAWNIISVKLEEKHSSLTRASLKQNLFDI